MRLIDVKALLEIEQGKGKVNPGVKILTHFNDENLERTRYGILSHCWIEETEEVVFREMEDFAKMEKKARDNVRRRIGYQKIYKTCELAHRDGFDWVWVDTCCINKESSAELSEAINSMYRWYAKAGRCYAYLYDLDESDLPEKSDKDKFKDTDGWPKWFSRGWTLQELIAPKEVFFYNEQWRFLGNKTYLARTLSTITGIPMQILRYGLDSDRPSTAQIMSWAASRRTLRVEDKAYSLLGLFRVHMPMLYGEGKNAFRRLQMEIIRMKNDHSIFAWGWNDRDGSVLADDPSFFRGCGDIVNMDPEEYLGAIKQCVPNDQLCSISQEQLRTCSVTNGGIQIYLLITQSSNSPVFEAMLACCRGNNPVRISLVLVKSTYHRSFVHVDDNPSMEFQQVFLAYNETYCDHIAFQFDASVLGQSGFVQEDICPQIVLKDNTLDLPASDRAAIAYFDRMTNTRFITVLGSYLGHPWAHLTFFRTRSTSESYAEAVYKDTQYVGPEQVQALHSATLGAMWNEYCLIKHLHLPHTISGIRLTYQRLPQPNTHSLTLDLVQCTGCCASKHTWQALHNVPVAESGILSHTRKVLATDKHDTLLIDGFPITFAQTHRKPGFELGDYGRWNNKIFEREGNIFNHLAHPLMRWDIRPIKHVVRHQLESYNGVDCVKFRRFGDLALRHPWGLSLPDDPGIKYLLKALSTRLRGKCLVTTVVQCSECHEGSYLAAKWPSYDGSNGLNHGWERLGLSPPLYTLTQPLLWYGEEAHDTARANFTEIRGHFYMLSKQLESQDAKVDAAVNFLSDLFGSKYLQGYIGQIVFFRSLAAFLAEQVRRHGFVGLDKESCSPATGRRIEVQCLHSRIESLSNILIQQMPTRTDTTTDHRLRKEFENKAKRDAREVGSQGFGFMLLQAIATSYQERWQLRYASNSQSAENEERDTFAHQRERSYDSGEDNEDKVHVDYDSIELLLEEVKILQMHLDVAKDEEERRALQEDITGKILLACWCGVRTELEHVLWKVADRVVHDQNVEPSVRDARVGFLNRIGCIFQDCARDSLVTDQHYLWRMVTEAEARTSKHALLLAAREQNEDVAVSSDASSKWSTQN